MIVEWNTIPCLLEAQAVVTAEIAKNGHRERRENQLTETSALISHPAFSFCVGVAQIAFDREIFPEAVQVQMLDALHLTHFPKAFHEGD